MASSRAKECGICNEVFNEDGRCPRMLPCFHCLCTNCINQLIQVNAKCCPFCRQEFAANSAQDLIINNGMIDLLRYIANSEASTLPPSKTVTTSSPEWLSAFRKDNDEISKENHAVCQRAEDTIANSICLNNSLREKMKNELINKITEIGVMYHRRVKFLEEENERLEGQLGVVKQNEKRMEVVKERLEAATTFLEAAPAMDEAGKVNADIQSLMGNLNNFIAEDERTRQGIEKIVQNTEQKIKDIREVLSSEEDAGIYPIPDVSSLAMQDPDPNKITSESLCKMSAPVRALVQGGKIYALQQNGSKLKFAKISVNKGKLQLHCLTDTLPPKDIHVIMHSDVMKLLDSCSRLAFMEVTGKEKYIKSHNSQGEAVYDEYQAFLGRVYFRFSKDTLRAKQFALLCTGELGPSYKISKILKVFDKGTGMERVLFGDYQSNNGTGGKGLVSGVAQEGKDEYDISWLAGSVVGRCDQEEKKAAQFYIRLGDIRGLKCNPSFGKVVEGLDVLRNVVSYINDKKSVVISDCGIVLNIQ